MAGDRLTLTVRHGPAVRRESFGTIDEAVAALERAAKDVRMQGPLSSVKALRDFEPDARVAARIEISRGRAWRGRTAGVDVMGDGRLVAYGGGIRRRELDPDGALGPFEAVRLELHR